MFIRINIVIEYIIAGSQQLVRLVTTGCLQEQGIY